jgi:colanic acid biosynthesis glycosyl transferase WcaI
MKLLLHDYAGHPFPIDLSRQLAAHGYRVTHGFFEGDPGPKGALARREGDPPTLSFKPFSIEGGYDKGNFINRRFKDVEYGRVVARHIEEAKYDLVISGNTPTEAQEHIIAACGKVGTLFIFWIQDFYSIAVSRILANKIPLIGNVIGSYYRYLERRQLRRSDGIVIITEAFRDLANLWGGEASKVTCIENWGSIAEVLVREKDNAWSREHGLDESFVFLYSGTLGLKHSPDLLIQLARQHLPNVKVVVVAQGLGCKKLSEAVKLEKLENLILLPLQPVFRLSEVLASSDVLVALLEADAGEFSVPSKVQSYLCASRPILLAAPKGNLATVVVTREGAGIAVEPDDISGFLTAARKFAEGNADSRTMAKNGRAYAARAYNISQVTTRFEGVFKAAADRNRNK